MAMEIITERLELGQVQPRLAGIFAFRLGKKPSEVQFVRKGIVVKSEPDPEECSSTETINTEDVDRDGEILMPKGAVLDWYKDNPQVMFGHNYSEPPIGRAAWVKKKLSKPSSLLAKTIYASTAFAQEIWTLVRDGFLPGRSVGFIPLEFHEPDEKEILKYPERQGCRKIIDKWELLEYSVVPIPSNRQALQEAMVKGLNLSKPLVESLGLEEEMTVCEPMKEAICSFSDVIGGKPYPHEHACRLKDPGAFQPDSFRRVNREHEGKEYSCIMGRLKGEATMTEQAYRYPKDTWTAASAKAHCKAHGSETFEPASEPRQIVRTRLIRQPVKIISLPPENVLDLRAAVRTIVADELDRLRGRV